MQIGDENMPPCKLMLLDEVFGAENRIATIPYRHIGQFLGKEPCRALLTSCCGTPEDKEPRRSTRQTLRTPDPR